MFMSTEVHHLSVRSVRTYKPATRRSAVRARQIPVVSTDSEVMVKQPPPGPLFSSPVK
jgi:hypothetical protein